MCVWICAKEKTERRQNRWVLLALKKRRKPNRFLFQKGRNYGTHCYAWRRLSLNHKKKRNLVPKSSHETFFLLLHALLSKKGRNDRLFARFALSFLLQRRVKEKSPILTVTELDSSNSELNPSSRLVVVDLSSLSFLLPRLPSIAFYIRPSPPKVHFDPWGWQSSNNGLDGRLQGFWLTGRRGDIFEKTGQKTTRWQQQQTPTHRTRKR